MQQREQEVIVMVGPPGSGKSTVSEEFKRLGYYVAHGDEHKTSTKMIKHANLHVIEGKSIVFDATNGPRKKRAEYVEFAKKHGLSIRCIIMKTSMEESMQRNNRRETPVPKIVYNIYKKNYDEPFADEGFCDIIRL